MKQIKYAVYSIGNETLLLLEDGSISLIRKDVSTTKITLFKGKVKRKHIREEKNFSSVIQEGIKESKSFNSEDLPDDIIYEALSMMSPSSLFLNHNLDWNDRREVQRFIKEHDVEELERMYLNKQVTVQIPPHPSGIGSPTNKIAGICMFIGYNHFLPEWDLQITVDRHPVNNIELSQISLTNTQNNELQNESTVNDC